MVENNLGEAKEVLIFMVGITLVVVCLIKTRIRLESKETIDCQAKRRKLDGEIK